MPIVLLAGYALFNVLTPGLPRFRSGLRVCVETHSRNALYHLASRKGFFEEEGLDIVSVTPSPSTAAVVLRGDADFGVISEEEFASEIEKGSPVLVFASIYLSRETEQNTNAAILIALPSSHAINPEASTRFVRALVRAQADWESSSEERAALMRELRPPVGDAETTNYRVSLDPMLLVLMEEATRAKRGPGNYIPNLLKFIDFGPLEATNPRAISIIH